MLESRITFLLSAALACISCVPTTIPDPAASDASNQSQLLSGEVEWVDEGTTRADFPTKADTGACQLRDGCFENIPQAQCESVGGAFVGVGSSCLASADNADAIAVLKYLDSDRDGRSDYDELLRGDDPNDPTDGPDRDGDGTPNERDPDVDGDRIPNAYDRDIDGDGIINALDNDRDGDFIANSADPDEDGDGIDNAKDDDDDADGDDDDDEETPSTQPADEENFDLLALARRLFDDGAADADPADANLVQAANDVLDEAESAPDNCDELDLAREFFERVIDENSAADQRADDEDRAFELFRKMFDEDGDGVFDAKDHDPNGDGSEDDDNDGVPDLQELKDGTDPLDSDSDDDGLSDGQEKQLGTSPIASDSDGDGLSDLKEARLHTDPLDSDTDDDGTPDGQDATPGGGG